MPVRVSDFMRTVLRATTAAAARALLGALGSADLAAHEADTTNVHGIADTSVLVTTSALNAAIAAAVTGLLDFKGATDCSSNPNYPAASKGDIYIVSVAGKIGGASGTSVDVGDAYAASADNAGGTEAAVGSSWFKLEHNLAGALLAANNLSDILNASTARTNLGLAIGSDVQAFLIAGTNIKTINGDSPLGSGDLTVTGSAAMPRGHIWGLTMSNAADTANDITVAAGEARNEANTADMTLAAAITKRLDAAWAVGNNQGGLNTGAEANSTWYEVHLIKRSDTGVVDVMFTTTANRATLPANYDSQRRIGWIRNDGSGNILQFVQVDDHFTLVTPQNDVSATATAARTSRTLTVPPSTIARIRAACLGNTAVNAANAVVISELAEADTAPTTTNGFASIGAGDFAIMGSVHAELRVDGSSQISDRAITATGAMAYDISTFGWIDHRLRLSG